MFMNTYMFKKYSLPHCISLNKVFVLIYISGSWSMYLGNSFRKIALVNI